MNNSLKALLLVNSFTNVLTIRRDRLTATNCLTNRTNELSFGPLAPAMNWCFIVVTFRCQHKKLRMEFAV